MTDWRDVFCGREAELASLRESWEAVNAGSGPRMAVVLGDRGMGKTRLVLEFYAFLTSRHDPDGYWPKASLFRGRNLMVGPDIERDPAVREHFAGFALGSRRMHFLWWGLRLGDPEDRNAAPTDLSTHHRVLSLHLEPLRQHRRLAENEAALAGVGRAAARSGVMKAMELIPGVGPALGLLVDGAGFTRRAAKLRAERRAIQEQQQSEQIARIARAGSDELIARTLAELDDLFSAPDSAMAGVPLVLFVDDAQFGRPDTEEGVLQLLVSVWTRAVARRWPLLLVASHWEREWWNADETAPAPDFAGTFRPLLTDVEGWHPLVLGKEPELGALVRAGLPGLGAGDVELILDRADGNPQLLMEIVDRVRRSPAWRSADGGDAGEGGLSPVGRRHLSTARFELHDLIRQRMEGDETPDPVRRAIAVSSVQGVEFSCSLVEAAATLLHAGGVREGLEAAEARHRYVTGVDRGVAGFLQRAYRDAAFALVDGQFGSADEVSEALAGAADDLIEAPDRWARIGPAEQDAVLALRASLGEDAPDPAVRLKAARAMIASARRALPEGAEGLGMDIARAAFWARRLSDGLVQNRWSVHDFELGDVSLLQHVLHYWSGAGPALPLTRGLVDRLRAELPGEEPVEKAVSLVEALWKLADGLILEFRHDEAGQVNAEAMERARALHERALALDDHGFSMESGALLAGCLERAADQAHPEDPEQVERLLRERLALTTDLAAAHPADRVSQANRTLALLALAGCLQREGPSDEAVELLLAAYEAESAAARPNPTVDGTRRLAAAVLALGEADLQAERPDEARVKLDQAAGAFRELFAIEPRQEHRIALCAVLDRAAEAAWDRGDTSAARSHVREALDLLEAVSPAPDPTHAWRQMQLYRAAAKQEQAVHAGDPAAQDALAKTLGDMLTAARGLLTEGELLCWGYAELAGRLAAALEGSTAWGDAEAASREDHSGRLFAETRTELARRNAEPALANWFEGGLLTLETTALAARDSGQAEACVRAYERGLRWGLDYVETIGGDEALGDLLFWVIIAAHETLDLGGRLDPGVVRECARVALAPPAGDEEAGTSRYRSPALSLLATLAAHGVAPGADLREDERLTLLEAAAAWFQDHGSRVATLTGYEAEIACGLLDHDAAERCLSLDTIERTAFADLDEADRPGTMEWRILQRLRRKWGCEGAVGGEGGDGAG